MNLKKVFFILHLPPPIHGAAIMGQIIKSSFVINNSFYSSYISLNTSNSLNEIGKSSVKKYLNYFGKLFCIFFKLFFNKPDLVYISLNSHGLGFIKDSIVVAICRFFKVPHVFHFHNKGVKKYSKFWIAKLLYPFVFKKARIILLSPLLYPDIESFVPKSYVYYCPNGISDFGFKNNLKLFSKNQPVRLLFLSNLLESKGIWDLIEACYLLKVCGFNFHLTIAGAEGDVVLSDLNKVISKYSLDDFITYRGKVNNDEKKLLFLNSDIFVHPTLEDCFPLVLLEAMQAGLPIVTTNEGAIPEIVENGVNGFIVPTCSPNSLKESIIKLINTPHLILEINRNNISKFKNFYTIDKFESSFIDIINRI